MTIAPRILDENPAEEDQLGGAHKRIANSIYELIRELDAEPQTVALEGAVGSGKSTVIGFLKDHLKHESDIDLFVFDSFQHKQGPLRRAFIEELVAYVSDTYTNSEQTEKKLELIKKRAAGRYVKIERSNDLKIKDDAFWFVMLFGVFTASLSALATLAAEGPKADDLAIVALLGITLTLPMIYVNLRKYTKSGFHLGQLLTSSGDSTFEETHSISNDVTSIDLRDLFHEIIEETVPRGKTIVIVIDNFDRLEPENLFGFWGDLETFSSYPTNNNNRVCLLVPYDNQQLDLAFRQCFPDSSAGDLLSLEFINKRFPIRYHVPQLIMSDWKSYLERCLNHVFDNEKNDVLQGCIKLFEKHHYYSKTTQNITPRHLKHFANDLSVLKSVQDEPYDLRTLSAYLLIIRTLRTTALQFIEDPEGHFELAHKTLGTASENWQEEIAALFYGVPKSRALEALLKQPLSEAVQSLDYAAYEQMVEVDGRHFIADDLLDQEDDFNFLSNFVICESGVSLPDKRLVESFTHRFNHIKKWEVVDHPYEFARALNELLDETGSDVSMTLFELLKAYLQSHDEEHFTQLLQNLDSLFPFANEAQLRLSPEQLVNSWYPQSDQLENISLSTLTFEKGDVSTCFQLISNTDHGDLFLELLDKKEEREDHNARFSKTPDGKSFLEDYERRLNSKELRVTDLYLLAILKVENKPQTLNNLLSDQNTAYIEVGRDEADCALIVSALSQGMISDHPFLAEKLDSLLGHHAQVFRVLMDRVFELFTLFQQADKVKIAAIDRLACRAVAERWIKTSNVEKSLRNHEIIVATFERSEEQVEVYWEFLQGYRTPIRKLVQSDNASEVFSGRLLDHVLDHENPLYDLFEEEFITRISSSEKDVEWWTSALVSPSELDIAAMDLVTNSKIDWVAGTEVYKAIHDVLIDLVERGSSPDDYNFLGQAIDHLADQDRNRLILDVGPKIFARALADSVGDLSPLLSRFPWLLDQPVSEEGFRGLARILIHAIESGQPSQPSWIEARMSDIDLDQMPNELKEVVTKCMTDAPRETQEQFPLTCQSLGISLDDIVNSESSQAGKPSDNEEQDD